MLDVCGPPILQKAGEALLILRGVQIAMWLKTLLLACREGMEKAASLA